MTKAGKPHEIRENREEKIDKCLCGTQKFVRKLHIKKEVISLTEGPGQCKFSITQLRNV